MTAEAVTVPNIDSKEDFEEWLKTIKGKFVLVSQYQPTGRPDSNWEEFATPESFEKMKAEVMQADNGFQILEIQDMDTEILTKHLKMRCCWINFKLLVKSSRS